MTFITFLDEKERQKYCFSTKNYIDKLGDRAREECYCNSNKNGNDNGITIYRGGAGSFKCNIAYPTNPRELSLWHFCQQLKYKSENSDYLESQKSKNIFIKLLNDSCVSKDCYKKILIGGGNKDKSKVRTKKLSFTSYQDYLAYEKSINYCPPCIN